MHHSVRNTRRRNGLWLALAGAVVVGCTAACHAGAGARHAPPGQACPSQDFSVFLQRYADPEDDRVRTAFTSDPLEIEVPTHRIEDETPTSPPTLVERRTGPARLELFQYRYFKDAGIYDSVTPGQPNGGSNAHTPDPVVISVTPGNGRSVAFGAEYEVDTFRFERKHGCWYLKRAIDLRD